jgi:hypothetical protein
VEDGAVREQWNVLTSYEAARPYIGMLVRLVNVTIVAAEIDDEGRLSAPINVGGGGLTPADIPKVTNELYDIAGTGPAIPENARFQSITGIVTYFYGFKIAPRSPSDFVL